MVNSIPPLSRIPPSASPPKYHAVSLRSDGIVSIIRSADEFTSAQDIDEERKLIGELLDRTGRAGRLLLVDSRLAPARTDFELREHFHQLRLEIQRGFRRTAVIVQSKLGLLQASRLARKDDPADPVAIFDDEQAALDYLKGS